MGVRGELFSTKVTLQNRTYFFNVKENRLGDLYLNIVESKNRDEGGFERQSVILFAEDLQEFLQGFDESLKVLEKAAREKRRGKASPPGERETDRDRGRDSDYPPAGRDRYRDSEKPYTPRRPRSSGPGRRGDGAGRGFSRHEPAEARRSSGSRSSPPGGRRSRFGNNDDQYPRPEGSGRRSADHRFEDKRSPAPRKKRVVVKKR